MPGSRKNSWKGGDVHSSHLYIGSPYNGYIKPYGIGFMSLSPLASEKNLGVDRPKFAHVDLTQVFLFITPPSFKSVLSWEF